jgi:hypothetical protein
MAIQQVIFEPLRIGRMFDLDANPVINTPVNNVNSQITPNIYTFFSGAGVGVTTFISQVLTLAITTPVKTIYARYSNINQIDATKIKIKSNTSYTAKVKIAVNSVSGTGLVGATFQLVTGKSDFSIDQFINLNPTSLVAVQPFLEYSTIFVTSASSQYICPQFFIDGGIATALASVSCKDFELYETPV